MMPKKRIRSCYHGKGLSQLLRGYESKETGKFNSHEFEDVKYIFGKSQSEPIFVILSIFFLSSGNFLNIVGVFGPPPESIYILPDFS